MKTSKLVLPAVMILCVPAAWALQDRREPHIGYVYPAGGQRDSVVHVLVGGQFLNRVKDVYVTGEGVRAKVVRHMGRTRRLNGGERRELVRQLLEAKSDTVKEFLKKVKVDAGRLRKAVNPKKKEEEVKLPKHPLLNNLEKLTPMELEFLVNEYLKRDFKKQPNAQIAETVLIEVTIDAAAVPGDREIRLVTPLGLTNPMCFQVGGPSEIREWEPVNPREPAMEPVDLPVTINGQITPGDVDRFRFRAREGQQLVIQAHARHLVPFLADAVPGWFQATLALFDADGKEAAFADDFRFDPDPVLFYKVPKTGVYELEIRDSIYRGRLDFVYRISVGEPPFIRSMFPLGGREGADTVASIDGWNLPGKRLPLDTRPGADGIRQAALDNITNSMTYAVDTLPECFEDEPNDTPKDARPVELPRIVNGRVATPGDVDVFRFEGKAGDEVVAEVLGRRLYSPLDSLLRLTDASGGVVTWNDDLEHKEGHLRNDMGSITHHADSYLRARLPKDGVYYVHLADTQRHGGEAYGYRLRIGPPRPDFSLRLTPSSINVRAGTAAPITVHALRKDGFDGEIELVLKDAPSGFKLQGAVIPAGCNRIRVTLTAPRRRPRQPVSLQLEGRAKVGERTIVRPAVPSEDMMQAFLYRHLVPCRELVVAVLGRRAQGSMPELAGDTPVRLPAAGAVDVLFKIPGRAKLDNIKFELDEPPEGVTLQGVSITPDGLKLVIKTDDKAQAGLEDNLIVEVFVEREVRRRGGKGAKQKRRFSIGVLPAIPVKIVRRVF